MALAWANSAWRASYEQLWETGFEIQFGSGSLALSLRELVNEGLMTIFFLIVGLEIKREVAEGELRDPSSRALPVFAALGGMILPALIFVGINFGQSDVNGWGIPMATDIALAVGIMSLARNVKPGLKLFLLALAIVDDIGAILVIAIFYSGQVNAGWIGVGALFLALVVVLQLARVEATWVYVLAGCGLWLALHEAGVHATLAGVMLGLLAPAKPYLSPELIDQSELTNLGSAQDVAVTTRMAKSAVSVVEWLEHRLHPWTSFLIVPLFALANAGISLSAESVRAADHIASGNSSLPWSARWQTGRHLGGIGSGGPTRCGHPTGRGDMVGIAGASSLAGWVLPFRFSSPRSLCLRRRPIRQDSEYLPHRSWQPESGFSSCASPVDQFT